MLNKQLGQCVGLWLAEGDHESTNEITFTNNQHYLISFFHKTLDKNFEFENKPRIYVYGTSKEDSTLPKLAKANYKFYTDNRANNTYFIYRISGRKLVREWLKITEDIISNKKFYAYILQGFFAGEGNIKYITRSNSRVVRIAQGKRNELIEDILRYFQTNFTYSKNERAYVISGRKNLENLIAIKIAHLHKEKDKKLKNMFNTYKQYHYPKGKLKDMIIESITEKPSTSSELAKLFKRDQTRVTRVLSKLKKEGNLQNFRVGSIDYWTRNLIVISKIKNRILELIDEPKKTSEIAKLTNRDWKSSFRRLKELEKLNLVKRENDLWIKLHTDKEVMIL